MIECDRGEAWVKLRHDSEPALEIRLVVTDGWANFYGVMGHDEAYSDSRESQDAWEIETVGLLAGCCKPPT